MLFTGHSEHTIDSKLRLAIPAKYRNKWDPAKDGSSWVSVPWPTGQIRLYTEAEYERVSSSVGQAMPVGEAADLQLMLFGLAEQLVMDSAGRIALPKTQLEDTGFKPDQQVIVVGAGKHMEIWQPEAFKTIKSATFARIPTLLQNRLQNPPASA